MGAVKRPWAQGQGWGTDRRALQGPDQEHMCAECVTVARCCVPATGCIVLGTEVRSRL